jgi:hypothetical protein
MLVKVLALVLSTVFVTVLVIAGCTVIVLTTPPHASPWLLLLGVLPLTILAYGPVTLGSIKTYFDTNSSQESKRAFALYFWVNIGVEILGAVAIILYALLLPAPAWLPVSFIVVAAALTALAFPIGTALRRRDERRPPTDTVSPSMDRRAIMRKIRAIAISFAGGLLVAGVGTAILLALDDRSHRSVGTAFIMAFGIACYPPAVTGFFVALPIAHEVRDSFGRDLGRGRRFARVVVRGKNAPIADDEQVASVRYAALISLNLGFTLVALTFLYVGIACVESSLFQHDPGTSFPFYCFLAILAAYVVILPLSVARIRRANRYAREHADLLKPTTASADPAA